MAFAQESVKRYETLTTIHGTVYEKVEILQSDPHGLTFRHGSGMAKIPFAELSVAFQELYDYKKDEAREFLREHAPEEPAARRIYARVYRPAKAGSIQQYLAGTYTSYFGGCPVTLHGNSYAGAVFSSRYESPNWVYPAPVNVPFNPVLWRQLQLCNHITFSRARRVRAVDGFGGVATKIHQHVHYPETVHRSVPAIGAGRGVPAIGATIQSGRGQQRD